MTTNGITYYLCGGTGINIGKALKAASRTPANKEATFIGLDASGANSPDDLFPVEYITTAGSSDQLARGSGKVKGANYEKAPAFVAQVLAKHKPSSFNVIVCNTAGGTGSMLGILVGRAIAKQGLPIFFQNISDFTSTKEKENAVGTLRSAANQTAKSQLDLPICFLHNKNTNDLTRGEVNELVVERLNLVSLFFTEANGEMDYADISNFLAYSRHSNIPPALSEVSFYDQDSVKNFKGKTPVAVASLFTSSDEVIPVFEGTSYRTTGVFAPGTVLPKGMTQLHMVLDHGEALAALESEMQALDDHKAEVATTYVKQKDVSVGADDSGMIL
jgi:hypothetical protein